MPPRSRRPTLLRPSLRLRLAVMLGLTLAALGAFPAPLAASEPAARAGAEAWLALVDAGKYPESWDEAAILFRKGVPKDGWVAQLGKVRTPLGATRSRRLTSATKAGTLPGAPAGEYVVLQYATSFANRQGAVETVTALLDQDGRWRVAGYFIK